jgi:predicted permease
VLRDIRLALRLLRRAPTWTAIALLSIALTVGATTVVFTAVKAVLLDPLPYARPAELIQVGTDIANAARSNSDWVFWNDAQELIRRNSTLESVGIYGNAVFDLAGDPSTPPEALYGLRVSASLFPALGVSPMLGRNILPEEDQPGGANVMILSHGLWRRRFNADRDVVGRTVKVNGQDCVVIGVMSAEFNFPLRRQAARTPYPYVEFWAPLQADPAESAKAALGFVARLRPGTSLSQAQSELASISSALAREFPATNRDRTHRMAYLRDRTVGNNQPALWLLMGAASLFLLIGCTNVAHLLLARGLSRRHEIVVRMAIGAHGFRILRQLLTESCVLAALGGLAGFALAAATWQILPVLVPASIPRLSTARPDGTVLVFALLAALINGILFGIAPALRASRWSHLGVRRGATGRHDRTRALLVATEVAVTAMLVMVGGQLLGSFVRLLRTEPGFDADRVHASVVLPAEERYKTPAARKVVYARFLNAVRAIPGVESAGTVNALPFSGENTGEFVTNDPAAVMDLRKQLVAETNIAGGDYLQTMGVRLIEGRWFREEDMSVPGELAIVDEITAKRLWPGGDPVGRQICVSCTPEHADNWKRVVGVVSTLRHSSLAGPPHANVYLSGGAFENATFLVVRSSRPPAELDRAVRAAIAAIDPDQPVLLSASMQSLIDDSVADRRFVMDLLTAMSAFALLMSAAGVYGVTTYAVSRRTQEIGVRMALGASARSILGIIFRQGFSAVALGLAAGFALTTALHRPLRALLIGLDEPDPMIAWIGALVVIFTTAAACWVPARRAIRIDPMSALRQE